MMFDYHGNGGDHDGYIYGNISDSDACPDKFSLVRVLCCSVERIEAKECGVGEQIKELHRLIQLKEHLCAQYTTILVEAGLL